MDEEKTTTKYFMESMIQKEFEEICNYRPPSSVAAGFETGMTARDRYEFNKINSERLFGKENG